MTVFRKQLAERQTDPHGRRWLFIPYDQLTDQIGPLMREAPEELGIVLIENKWKASRRPYHQQKLALILANLRHFALEQAERGVAVKHIVTNGLYRAALEPLCRELGPMRLMIPAERELRADLQPLVESGALELIPHEGWLTTVQQFQASHKAGPPWRMDRFYRHIRRATGILMENGKPVGGKFSFDPENRRAWKGQPPAPTPPTFPNDPIKTEVAALIETAFAHHPGHLDMSTIPATREDAEVLWQWARKNCLPWFGPYEDAMSTQSRSLFHTRLSALINLHRLLPKRLVTEVAQMDLPMPSKEGFIRQVLGWREFVHHVHVATDGFRQLPTGTSVATTPGDAGYHLWAGKSWPVSSSTNAPDGGAKPSALGSETPLPPAYWGKKSGLACLDQVVAEVWNEGYSHHITRLMVLANIATLLDVSPRELTDWFWIAYTDAYDWVVEPNVLGMGSFAIGDLITTKPYVAGAAYINRMSDYCSSCAFDPDQNCPLTNLYWAFLARHEKALQNNQRLRLVMVSLRKRGKSRQQRDEKIFHYVRDTLMTGERIKPENLPINLSTDCTDAVDPHEKKSM
ncbi:MAG: cryptochrome/photolyase family protein [candidate division KSB1 bacterium]|nr:cryptochrome/photolyase family protein [candidate division KSB1 bacterium]MDZ7302591.1 cryptochrome/photolyase family protein [candidate division KSB1 bacterium]MDZ7311568.1 cryptochrome/photolyase family protein [candidate division KSB1 bacterium]